MLLAIDIGNSNIVIGCMNGMQIENEFRIATDFVKTSDQYCIDLKNVLSLCDIHVQDLEGVIISSVVPPLLNSFRSAVMKLTGKKPMVVGPGIRTGLNIQIDNPAQIGSDLIVAAVAALHEYSAPTSAAASARASAFLPRRFPRKRRFCRASTSTSQSAPSAATQPTVCAAALCSELPPCSTVSLTGWRTSSGSPPRSWQPAAFPDSSSPCAAGRWSTTGICCSRVSPSFMKTTKNKRG